MSRENQHRGGIESSDPSAPRTYRPLEGIRVVELGEVIAGAMGGMLLADLGAEVIKIERPGGDAGRRDAVYGMNGESAIHMTYNRNKKSMAVDLKTTEGRQVLLDLVAHSDAIVENFRPGVLDRLGVGFEELRKVNSSLVCVSVSGFGEGSPYRDLPAYDVVVQAMSGHMSIMGEPGRPPVVMGVPMADMLAGVYSAIAILAGVHGAGRDGEAVRFDVAMLDVMLSMLGHVGTLFLNTGTDQIPQGSSHPFITPWQVFACADDHYIAVAPREEHFWVKLRQSLGCDDLKAPRFADAESRARHRDELIPILEKAFSTKSAVEWLAILRAAGVPAGPVNRMGDIFDDPHVSSRGVVRDYTGAAHDLRLVRNPLRIDGPGEPILKAAPRLGEDTDRVLLEVLGYSADRLAGLRRDDVVR